MFYRYNQKNWQKIDELIIQEPAVFTTFRADSQDLMAHLQRLNEQSKGLSTISLSELRQAQKLGNMAGNWIIKVIVTQSNQWFMAKRLRESKIEPLHLETVLSVERNGTAKIKDFHRNEYLIQLQKSYTRGFDDALYYLESGAILETTIANIFWSDGQKLYMPSTELPILVGTFQQYIVMQLQQLGFEMIQGQWTVAELKKQAVQMWRCNAVHGCQLIDKLDDDWHAKPTALTNQLTKIFKK
ncbi:MAG: aminotransferase class IV [Culicoidibacterales bacterium]